MTVIFSTHDVSMVAEVADYVYVMNKGQFVAEGSVEEIFLQPDMLRSVRLDVPVLPKLIRSLNNNGVPVPMAYTYEDAERALIQYLQRLPEKYPATMIEELFYIEKTAYKDSFIHRLDARVKIVSMFALIIAMVALPYSPVVFTVGLIFLLPSLPSSGHSPGSRCLSMQNACLWFSLSGSLSSSSRSFLPTGIIRYSTLSPIFHLASISMPNPSNSRL